MRGLKWGWIVILCSAVLFGCQKGIVITIIDPDAIVPSFKLTPGSPFASDGDEITVFWVAESKSSGGKALDVVWHIESSDGTPKHVERIKFGTVPDGFRQVGEAKPLVAGAKYEVGAGMPGKIGSLVFIAK
jgi:hypothetical protein